MLSTLPSSQAVKLTDKKPTAKSNGKKYIFCTYQSADKISNAQQLSRTTFDLIICDEAHRTAGMRSNFSLALEDKFIRSKKRLFMTATERMVRPMLLRRAQNNGQVIFSMDDENVYYINEPYGFIDIRFDCDKDKQEEYFVNKNIVLVLDK